MSFEGEFPSLMKDGIDRGSASDNPTDWEWETKTIQKCCLDKQKVLDVINKLITESKKHQLTRLRFEGNIDNEFADDCKQIGKQYGLEELKKELGIND